MAKSPILALILSFFIPGLGQIYAGKIMFGIILIILAFIFGALIYVIGTIAWILYVILWLYGMYDAYTTVKATETPAAA